MEKVDIAAAAWKQQSWRSSVKKGVIVEHHGKGIGIAQQR